MNPMIKPTSLQQKIHKVRSDRYRCSLLELREYNEKESSLTEAEEVCEYAFFEIVRDIPDKASLEVVKSAFENMLSKEKIEEIVNFVDSMRK